VSPAMASYMLGVGLTHLYKMLHNNELVSFCCGRARKITAESIQAYIARQVAAAANKTTTDTPPRRKRGRPRKVPTVATEQASCPPR
jgi:excisionase family DNA binding protein